MAEKTIIGRLPQKRILQQAMDSGNLNLLQCLEDGVWVKLF